MSIVGATIGFSAVSHLMRARTGEAEARHGASGNRDTLAVSTNPDVSKTKSSSETGDTRDAKTRAADDQKNRAREMLQRLVEELKLVKKLWAHDLKGMAKQIARIAEQLKEALELYKDAHEALHGKSGGIVGLPAGVSGLTAVPAAPMETAGNEGEAAEADAENSQMEAEALAEQDEVASAGIEADVGADAENGVKSAGQSLGMVYKTPKFETYRLDQTDEAIALSGDFEFMDMVRGVKRKLKETLQDTKEQAMFRLSGKAENSEAFKDAEKALEELDEDLKTFEQDLKRQMPPAIMVSRIA